MFDYERTIKKLEDFKNINSRKQEKFLKNLFLDEDFIEWLYDSGKQTTTITVAMVDELYTQLSKPKTLEAIYDMIVDEGYDYFQRTHATFLYSIANFALELNNERAKVLNEELDKGSIDNREAKQMKAKLEKFGDLITDIIKLCKKIVKPRAKYIASKTNLPKTLCMYSFWHVPDSAYVPSYKVGYYLNGLLNIIYKNAAETGFATRRTIYWNDYFKEIFGKKNLPSVATFILLEGVNRIDKYKDLEGIDSVKECWDSLTEFALKELNNSPDEIRSQMIELYIKRIDKMFKNNSYDLRVNILSLPSQFRNLISTISKYKDRIKEILYPEKKANK